MGLFNLFRDPEPPLVRGSRLIFGKRNGKPIEWRVLDVSNGKALLITEKIIHSAPYHKEHMDITWDRCSLRIWLNTVFLRGFNEDESAKIMQTTVSTSGYSTWHTTGGGSTLDEAFCLSVDEAKWYFRDDADRMAERASNVYNIGVSFLTYTSPWWLRSPGYWQSYAAYIDADGSICKSGGNVFDGSIGVRPAMWIKL